MSAVADAVDSSALDRKRLLFLTQEFTSGGAAYLTLRHIQRLQNDYDIDLLVTEQCDDAMLAQLPPQVEVFRIEARSLKADVNALWCLNLLLRQRQTPPFQRVYQAILATSLFPSRRACIAFSLLRARRKFLFLVDERLARYPRLLTPERSVVECALIAADLVLPVSNRLWHSMAANCPPLTRRPWHVLTPPIDHDRILSQSLATGPGWSRDQNRDRNACPVVLTVARLSTEKQIMQCLQIHHRLRQAGLQFHWYIVGEGPERALLQAEILRLQMSDVFFLAGRQDNVYAWMKQCDMFALLSASEGCPTVVIEALTVGCAVIMTDVNGADELIENERTGLIVSHSVQAMSDGLARLIAEPDLRERFRQQLANTPQAVNAISEKSWLIAQIEQTMPDVPLVSILIPTYNQQHSISRAVNSALSQNFASFEVVVADDASTDQTGAVAQSCSTDPRLRYIRNETNLGRVANYRRALTDYARGEWVLMLDGDDFLTDPGFIQLAWDALQQHQDRPIVFAQAGHRLHYQDSVRPDVDIVPPIEMAQRLMSGGEYLRFVYDTGFFTHLGTLYKRDAAIATGCYTADISASDMDSLLRLALEGDVIILNTIAGCWVQHGANASANLPRNKISANVRIYRQIAATAVQRGVISLAEIETPLGRYEARTFAYLFGQTLGKAAHGPLAPLKMLAVMLSVDPRLLLNRHLLSVCRSHWPKLTQLLLRRWRHH